MQLRKLLLFALTLSLACASTAENIIWQNDFEQTDDIKKGVLGPPTEGFGCRKQIVDRKYGKNKGLNIIFKGLSEQEKISGNKSFKLEISSTQSKYFYFYSKRLSKKVAITPDLYFSGYLYKDQKSTPKTVVKICPRFETIRLKDKKKKSFEFRIGGFSPTGGLTRQSTKNWHFFNMGLDTVINKICDRLSFNNSI